MGAALAARPRDEYVLSTKVGRLVRPRDAIPAGCRHRPPVRRRRDDAYYTDVGDRGLVFDYSGDGVRRSLEESLERLGLPRVDIVYIHDPDDHWDAAMRGAYPALERLASEGTVRAIGAGMNQTAMLTRFVARDRHRRRDAGRPLHPARPGGPAGPAATLCRAGRGRHGGRRHEQRCPRGPGCRRAFRLPARARPGRRPGSPDRRGLRAPRGPAPRRRDPVPARPPVGHRADRGRPDGRPPRRLPGGDAARRSRRPSGTSCGTRSSSRPRRRCRR